MGSCPNLRSPFVKANLWVLDFSSVDSEVESHEFHGLFVLEQQHFSSINVHTHHLRNLVKMQILKVWGGV